jgi:hypothetical protein
LALAVLHPGIVHRCVEGLSNLGQQASVQGRSKILGPEPRLRRFGEDADQQLALLQGHAGRDAIRQESILTLENRTAASVVRP